MTQKKERLDYRIYKPYKARFNYKIIQSSDGVIGYNGDRKHKVKIKQHKQINLGVSRKYKIIIITEYILKYTSQMSKKIDNDNIHFTITSY